MTPRFRMFLVLSAIAATGCAVFAIGYRNARADPVVRRATVALPAWPVGAPPVTVALLADLHIGNASMDADRLMRIVVQVNALHPDMIVIAGDFIAGHAPDSARQWAPLLVKPLAKLRAPLGVVAVLGNHDHWTGAAAVTTALRRADVLLLSNAAVRRGPLAIAGLDDPPTHHARLARTLAAVGALDGAGVMIAHSPMLSGRLSRRVRLVLAGHTHCGQVVLPIIGAPQQVTDGRYRCGLVRHPGRLTIVTAGLGTSMLPIRFGAPPDLWLVRLGPTAAAVGPLCR